MATNCSYNYQGKTYSTDRILRKLVEELPSRSQQQSVDFLMEYLGMTIDEITIVSGLIDNKALGRFRKDGSILLSDLANVDVAYHEAFHRVWRLYLSNEERLSAIKEIKARKNFQSILDSYRTVYPKLSENELIEEVLADEFADYTLNKNFKVEVPLKSLFTRLMNFIKKLLGIKSQDIQMIYDKILAKTYKGSARSAQQYLKDADKILIEGYDFSVEEKNELIQSLTQQFVKAMLEVNGDVDLFLTNPKTKIKSLIADYVVPTIGNDLLDISEDKNGVLVDAFYADVDKFTDPTGTFDSSVFINGMVKNLKLIGLNIKDDSAEDTTGGALESSEKETREFAPSVEFDPKSKIGKKIKLLLSSLVDTNQTTTLGLAKPVSWSKAFNQIALKMAGIPTSDFMLELRALNLSYVNELADFLDKDSIFKNKFISTMAMTENKFMIMQHKDGDIFFYDANSGTRENKIINDWKNGLIRKSSDWVEWLDIVKDWIPKLSKVSDDEIIDHLGFAVNPQIQGLRTDLQTIVTKLAAYKGEKPDSKKIFDQLNIEGFVKALSKKQAKFEDQQDLMVNLNGKKVYTLGLNTQQSTVINAVRYAQSKFTPEMTIPEKIEILKQYAQFQVSEFNLTKLSNGEYLIQNKWLEKILNGEQLDLIIPAQIKTEDNQTEELANLNEPDLMSLHINGALNGVTMSMKHADRSTFFAYSFGKPIYGADVTDTVENTLDILVENIKEQIELEAKFVRTLGNQSLPVQYIGKMKIGGFAETVGMSQADFNKLVDGEQLENTIEIYKFVRARFNEFQADAKEWGLLDEYSTPIYKDGKRKGELKRIKGINNSLLTQYGSLELTLAAAFVNEASNHIFENRFFSGDVKAFKNGTDLFKRLAPQSSTGNLSVNSLEANLDIRNRLNQVFEVVDPRSGAKAEVNPAIKIGLNKDKYFRAVTGAERSDYKSHLLQPATTPSGKPIVSKLTGKQESKLFMLFEHGYINDFPNQTIEQLQKTYEPKFRLYEEKYSELNENDGISYMTLPAFKKFMLKQGNWTDGMELAYQIEMKIASLKSEADIAQMEITHKGVTFKPFEIRPNKETKSNGWSDRIVDGKRIKLDAVHTLKTQFGGYSTPEEYYDNQSGELAYLFNSVFKTSQHLLLPSAILGSNLQLMNFSLLTNGVDIYHMGSANKVGGVDPQLAAKNIQSNNDDIRNSRKFITDISERGLDFYSKDGFFNHEALTENLDILSYLSEWDFLKDQVSIGNKVKNEIKGSTQSLKILLSNLIVNGEERFVGAQELVESYKEIVREIVENNHDGLLARIGFNIDTNEFNSLDQLKKAILGSSQMQSAPENIRNSIENFFNDPSLGVEAIPMKNKIENVLYSLITNGIISFDRPGTSYPQAAITGYEKLGTRTIDQSNQDALKFYNPVFDEDGNVIKVEPAEVIIPLPDYWIGPLLRWAKTNNLVEAINKLNADIKNRPEVFQFKGLRIPNQQLSSNDIFQVKKFNLPTMQNYILIPSEMVAKTGGDFDIDKLNIYWAKDSQDKIFSPIQEDDYEQLYARYVEISNEEGNDSMTFDEFKANYKTSADRLLLNKEIEILLHPKNVHHLLMPLTDEVFVKDIYNSLKKEGLIEEPSKSFMAAMFPSVNVKNTIIFIKGKQGVGIIALGITNKSTNQADTLTISQNYKNNDGKVRPLKLLFDTLGLNYRLDGYTDNLGTIVSEIQSHLLTTQVDNVKNPTAVLMNINMQTLSIIDYLVRRGVNPKSVIYLFKQPLVTKYLKDQVKNESYFNKQADSEVSKKDLINGMLESLGYTERYPSGLPDPYNSKDQLVIKDSDLRKAAQENKFDAQQLKYFSYFLELQEQATAFGDFQSTQNSDTKGLKDKQALDEADLKEGRVNASEIINSSDIARLNSIGVIAPFYQFGRQRYKIFNPLYSLSTSQFGSLLNSFKEKASIIAPSADKDRVRQTIENDFILFLIHNYTLNKNEFNRLTKDESVAKRVLDLKIKLSNNLVLKAFFPMLNNTTDQVDKTKIDNLRLFEKDLTALDDNDLKVSLEEIAEADLELYNDIVKLLFFQSGLNISPFNYRNIVPVGLNQNRNEFNEYQYLYQDLIQQAVQEMIKQTKNAAEDVVIKMFSDFKILFAANNPQFLRKNFRHPEYPYDLMKNWSRDQQKFFLKSKQEKVQIQLGDSYHKQYFRELIDPNVFLKSKTQQNSEKDLLNAFEPTFNEDTQVSASEVKLETATGKYELFPGVFATPSLEDLIEPTEFDDLAWSRNTGNYSPPLKMYEGFIKINQLYQGDEVLPFIGESEYYRYLVPMLLKMNPKVGSQVTGNIRQSVINESFERGVDLFNIIELEQVDYSRARGMSIRSLNAGFIRNDAPTQTIVHELIHRTLQQEYEKSGDFFKQINNLFDYSVANSSINELYGYTSPTEFLAEALSDPEFMSELNNINYKDETIWSYLMTLISDFINNLLSVELKSDSVLAEVVRLSEQVLNNNLTELSKDSKVELSTMQNEIVNNWNNYFPQYSWMNEAQKLMTAKLAEEGKITLNCKI